MSQPTYQRRQKLNYASDTAEVKAFELFGTDLYVPYTYIPQNCASDEVSVT